MSGNEKFVQGNTITVVISAPSDFDLAAQVSIRWAMARSMQELSDPTVQKTLGFGLTRIDGNTRLQIELDDDETKGLSGQYVHEAVCTDGQGNVTTITAENGDPFTITFRRRIAVAP